MSKEKITLEYDMHSSIKVLFNRLCTAGGLNEWFADDVKVQGKKYTFVWDGSEQVAEMINKKDLKYVRFKWDDDDDEKAYFEFRINIDELTNDIALVVTDFADSDEIDSTQELWDSQIAELKHILGT